MYMRRLSREHCSIMASDGVTRAISFQPPENVKMLRLALLSGAQPTTSPDGKALIEYFSPLVMGLWPASEEDSPLVSDVWNARLLDSGFTRYLTSWKKRMRTDESCAWVPLGRDCAWGLIDRRAAVFRGVWVARRGGWRLMPILGREGVKLEFAAWNESARQVNLRLELSDGSPTHLICVNPGEQFRTTFEPLPDSNQPWCAVLWWNFQKFRLGCRAHDWPRLEPEPIEGGRWGFRIVNTTPQQLRIQCTRNSGKSLSASVNAGAASRQVFDVADSPVRWAMCESNLKGSFRISKVEAPTFGTGKYCILQTDSAWLYLDMDRRCGFGGLRETRTLLWAFSLPVWNRRDVGTYDFADWYSFTGTCSEDVGEWRLSIDGAAAILTWRGPRFDSPELRMEVKVVQEFFEARLTFPSRGQESSKQWLWLRQVFRAHADTVLYPKSVGQKEGLSEDIPGRVFERWSAAYWPQLQATVGLTWNRHWNARPGLRPRQASQYVRAPYLTYRSTNDNQACLRWRWWAERREQSRLEHLGSRLTPGIDDDA